MDEFFLCFGIAVAAVLCVLSCLTVCEYYLYTRHQHRARTLIAEGRIGEASALLRVGLISDEWVLNNVVDPVLVEEVFERVAALPHRKTRWVRLMFHHALARALGGEAVSPFLEVAMRRLHDFPALYTSDVGGVLNSLRVACRENRVERLRWALDRLPLLSRAGTCSGFFTAALTDGPGPAADFLFERFGDYLKEHSEVDIILRTAAMSGRVDTYEWACVNTGYNPDDDVYSVVMATTFMCGFVGPGDLMPHLIKKHGWTRDAVAEKINAKTFFPAEIERAFRAAECLK